MSNNHNDSKNNKDEAKYNSANKFFDIELCEVNKISELLPDVDGKAGDYSFTLEADLKSIKTFTNALSIPLPAFMASAFAYTLSRYTGCDNALINIIDNGRGGFSNTKSTNVSSVNILPVVFNCADTDIVDYLLSSNTKISKTLEYNFIEYEKLANEYDINSSVMIQYDLSEHLSNIDSDNAQDINIDKNDSQVFTADLKVNVIEDKNNIHLNITHSNKYSHTTIKSIAKCFNMIVAGMLTKDKLSEINLVTEDDLHAYFQINKTETPLKYDDILQAFTTFLNKYPNNALVTYKNVTYSYAQGACAAQAIADALNNAKVKQKSHVAILVNRSEWYLLGALGVLTQGSAYVPIDDAYPDTRISFMLKDTCASAILVTDKTNERVEHLIQGDKLKTKIINLSKIDIPSQTCAKKQAKTYTYTKPDKHDTACVLYTSGTTGKPKGSLITRLAITNHSEFCSSYINMNHNETFSLYAAYTFDAHIKSMYTPICVGAQCDVVPDSARLSIDKLHNYISDKHIDYIFTTTQIAKLYMSNYKHSYLKAFFVGGEKLGSVPQNLNYRVLDAYGPTENTVFSCLQDAYTRIADSSIGKPNMNTKAYILDNNKRLIPKGAVGELCLSGYQLAKGYLNRSEDTNKAFVDNPYDRDTPEYKKMYMTGDMVRLLPDNTLGFVGRKDTQIKIRGNRVETGEVEACVRELKEIADVTVQAIDVNNTKELIAYYVLNKNADPSDIEQTIRSHVGNNKPAYMVPAFVEELEKIPLNVNGKVDKRKLPAPNAKDLQEEYISAQNKTQALIIDAFEKVLGIDKIGINDDFITLGGDSLKGIRLLTEINDIALSLEDLLKLRTPKNIADYIKNSKFTKIDCSFPDDYEASLSASQKGIYYDIVSKDLTASYIIPFELYRGNKYIEENILASLDKLISKFPVLSTYVSKNSNSDLVLKDSDCDLVTIDYKADRDDIISFLSQPFDIEKKLARFIVTKKDDEFFIYGAVHHLVFDGYSIDVLKDAFYKLLNGGDIACDEGYKISSRYDEQVTNSDLYKEAKEFYDSKFYDIENIYGLVDSAEANQEGAGIINLDIASKDIDKCLSDVGVSRGPFFASVFGYVLSRFSCCDKTYFCYIDNGRDRLRLYDSVGMFVKTVPIIMDCNNQPIDKYIKNASKEVYDSIKYSYYPFYKIASDYSLNIDVLFQYFFDESFNGKYDDNTHLGVDDEGEMRLSDKLEMINGFSFSLVDNGKSVYLRGRHSDKFSHEFFMSFMNTFKLAIKQVVDNYSDKRLSDITLITKSDRDFIDKYNYFDRDLGFDSLFDLYMTRVKQNPFDTYVKFKNVSISYSHSLRESIKVLDELDKLKGIDDLGGIAFLVDRSHYYTMGILASVVAGCPYMPIDDTYPDGRIIDMITDCPVTVLLVNNNTIERGKSIVERLNKENFQILNLDEIGLDFDSQISNEESKSLVKKALSINANRSNLDSVALYIYTSGTTGKPKGVMLPHLAILSFANWYVYDSKMNSDDSICLYGSIGFDVHIKVFFSSMYAGATVEICPEELRLNIEQFGRFLDEKKVTHLPIPFTFFKLFIDTYEPKTLSIVTTGGEALGDIKINKDFDVCDVYGPTEATCNITSIKIRDKCHYSSVGHPVTNSAAYILDSNENFTPIGGVGELYVSGYQLAVGYHNNEKETSKKFVQNKFSNKKGYEKMYATGDFVRYLSDGTLSFIGRRDHQVKIRGNRIEIHEVENCIAGIKGINETAVVVLNEESGTKELAAYVVVDDDDSSLSELSDKELQKHIYAEVTKTKPKYMAPLYAKKIDKMPLTYNLKVNKKLLPEIQIASDSESIVLPRNEIEEKVHQAFCKVLNISKISVDDGFMSLGGDSIKAIRLVSELNKFGYQINSVDILNNISTEDLAKIIAETDNTKQYHKIVGEVPLNAIQQQFFKNRKSNYFTQSFLCECSSKLDIDIFKSAFKKIESTHDMLRAIYSVDENDTITQIIREDDRLYANIKQWKFDPQTNIKTLVEHHHDNSKDIINYLNGCLSNVDLYDCGNKMYMFVTIHHLVIDGLSWYVLLDDLSYAYSSLVAGKEFDLKRSASFKEYNETLNKQADAFESNQLRYWKRNTEKLSTSNPSGICKLYVEEFNICDFHDMFVATDQEILVALFARAYKKTFGSNLILGLETHGRNDNLVNTGRTIGWFTSSFPVNLAASSEDDVNGLRSDIAYIQHILRNVPYFGLGYSVLKYFSKTIVCTEPEVFFNYFADSQTFKNDLFVNVDSQYLEHLEGLFFKDLKTTPRGMMVDVKKEKDKYIFQFKIKENSDFDIYYSTFISLLKQEFVLYDDLAMSCRNNVAYQLLIGDTQRMILLDEYMNYKGTAYSCNSYIKMPAHYTEQDVELLIDKLLAKHPVLSSRLVRNNNIFYFVTDIDVPIKKISENNISIDSLVASISNTFSVEKNLSQFYIIYNDNDLYLYFDIHHIICDAQSCVNLSKEIQQIIDNKFDETADLVVINRDANLGFYKINALYYKYKDIHRNMFDKLDGFCDIAVRNYSMHEMVSGEVMLTLTVQQKEFNSFCIKNSTTEGIVFTYAFLLAISLFCDKEVSHCAFMENGRHTKNDEMAIGLFANILLIVFSFEDKSLSESIKEFSRLYMDLVNNTNYPIWEFVLDNSIPVNHVINYNKKTNSSDDHFNMVDVNFVTDTIADFVLFLCDTQEGYHATILHSSYYQVQVIRDFMELFDTTLSMMLQASSLRQLKGNIFSNLDKGNVIFNEIVSNSILFEDSPTYTNDVLYSPESISLTIVKDVFRKALGYDEITNNTNFVKCGGTSISAMKATVEISKFSKYFDIEKISPVSFLNCPNPVLFTLYFSKELLLNYYDLSIIKKSPVVLPYQNIGLCSILVEFLLGQYEFSYSFSNKFSKEEIISAIKKLSEKMILLSARLQYSFPYYIIDFNEEVHVYNKKMPNDYSISCKESMYDFFVYTENGKRKMDFVVSAILYEPNLQVSIKNNIDNILNGLDCKDDESLSGPFYFDENLIYDMRQIIDEMLNSSWNFKMRASDREKMAIGHPQTIISTTFDFSEILPLIKIRGFSVRALVVSILSLTLNKYYNKISTFMGFFKNDCYSSEKLDFDYYISFFVLGSDNIETNKKSLISSLERMGDKSSIYSGLVCTYYGVMPEDILVVHNCKKNKCLSNYPKIKLYGKIHHEVDAYIDNAQVDLDFRFNEIVSDEEIQRFYKIFEEETIRHYKHFLNA